MKSTALRKIHKTGLLLKHPSHGWLMAKQKFYKRFPALQNDRGASPLLATVFLAYRCNLSCSYCGFWGDRGMWKDPARIQPDLYLPFELFRKLVDGLKSYRTPLLLTGGEAFLNPEWISMVCYAKKNALPCELYTNGTFLERESEALVTSGLNILRVSLDGHCKEVHDSVRGDGSFEKTLEGLHAINDTKKKARNNTPEIELCYTVCKENEDSLIEMVRFVENLDIRVSSLTFQHLLFTDTKTLSLHNRMYGHPNGTPFSYEVRTFPLYSPQAMDTGVLRKQVSKVYSHVPENGLRLSFFPELKEKELEQYYTSPVLPPGRFSGPCLAPWCEAVVFPDGSVELCPDYVIGNLRENSFSEMWNSEKARMLRTVVLEKKTFPVCKSCCKLYKF